MQPRVDRSKTVGLWNITLGFSYIPEDNQFPRVIFPALKKGPPWIPFLLFQLIEQLHFLFLGSIY